MLFNNCGFCSSNALYSASLSFRMFTLTFDFLTLPREFIFVSVQYFIGLILLKKSCQFNSDRFGKKIKTGEGGDGHIGGRGSVYRRGIQTISRLTLWSLVLFFHIVHLISDEPN